MQAVEVVLFIVVAALALSLVAYLVIPRLRAGIKPPAPRVAEASPRPASSTEMICPTCGREYPAGLKFCPADARPLVASANAQSATAVGLACPVCRRSFDGGKKFCPYDAEELAPVTAPAAMARRAARAGGPPGLAHVLGKICPHCSKRYESDATFCGRDGSELVSIN
jgi:predicted amidophosphoribosyltransferase